jgi:hypothetical protein
MICRSPLFLLPLARSLAPALAAQERAGMISVNGRALSAVQVRELKRRHGVPDRVPVPTGPPTRDERPSAPSAATATAAITWPLTDRVS